LPEVQPRLSPLPGLNLRRQMRALEEAKKNQDLDYQRKLDEERKRIEAQALLRQAFPMDEIVPVPKGMNGADLLQRVRSPSGLICFVLPLNTITEWQPLWLQKLKDDQQASGAELAVIVTAAMPKDRSGNSGEPFVREADVWIARFDAARPLAQLLRSTLLELHKLRQANHGRSEKMELVYNYICSPQFAQRLKTVSDGFEAMRQELDTEKAAFTRIWKRRESQCQPTTTSFRPPDKGAASHRRAGGFLPCST
jgi:hypothetical protein